MPIDIASGNLYEEYEDVSLPGRLELSWVRRYSGLLTRHDGHLFGRGWSTPFEVTLTRYPQGFEFIGPSGGSEVIPDRDGLVEAGVTLREFGAFIEIFMLEGRYIVQAWEVDGPKVRRYCFHPGPRGQPMRLTSIEDPEGQALDLTWDSGGLLCSVRQRLEGRSLQFGYNRLGCIDGLALHTVNGSIHQLFSYEYDAGGHLVAAVDAAGFAQRWYYDMDGRLARQVGRDGGVFHYRYDSRGRCVFRSGLNHYDEKRIRYLDATRITEVIDSYGETRRYQYLPSGQVIAEWDPLGAVKRTEFDAFGRVAARIDALGGTTRFGYDATGNRDRLIDALGRETRLTFNASHQPLSWTDPLEQTWSRIYDARNRLIAAQDPAGQRWCFRRDEQGNLVEIVNPMGAVKRQRFTQGVLEAITDWMGHETNFIHDDFGRLLERVGPQGDSTRMRYDVIGRCIQVALADGASLSASYDHAGNMTSFVDALGHTTRWRFGPCSRLLERVDGLGQGVRFVWGSEPGRLDQLINERREAYSFERDAAGRIVKEVSFDGSLREFRYDASGEIVGWMNADGEVVTICRDALHQVVAQILPDGEAQEFVFDAVGRLAAARKGDHTVTFERDAQGRIIREQQGPYVVSSRYDALGGVLGTSTSLGYKVDYELDPNGGITKLVVQDRHMIAFARDEYGQAVSAELPGQIRLSQQFDPMGRLIEQSLARSGPGAIAGRGGEAQLARHYRYDLGGRLRSLNDGQWGCIDYVYDPAERLIQTLSTHGVSERFEYDPSGNLLRVQREGMTFTDAHLTYAQGNRLIQRDGTLYEYDVCGRLVRKTESDGRIWTYGWNALNQLKTLGLPDGRNWAYCYDALGRRISKVEQCGAQGAGDRRDYIWDKDTLVHEIEPDASPKFWVFDPHGFSPLASVQDECFFSIVTDHLGDPLEFFAVDGSKAWSGRRTAWGEPDPRMSSAQTAENPWAYAGQYRDAESGLHYNYFRYYDSAAGRYISPDPVGLEGGFNLYRYTVNPTNWSDPYGLTCPHDTNGGEGYVVYHIKDRDGTVVYVGITEADRFRTRRQEHTDSGRLSQGRTMHIAEEVPTYGAARGYEQAHIEHYGTRDTSLIGNYNYRNNPGNRVNSFDTSRTDDRAQVYNQHYLTAQQNL